VGVGPHARALASSQDDDRKGLQRRGFNHSRALA
jgi:hypothetical protein